MIGKSIMLLNDIGPNPTSMLKKVNYYLESTYGFKISENTTTGRYETILEQIEDEIQQLKLQGEVSKNSPEISKRLLILEGITYLREYYNQEFQSPDLEKVCGILCDFICDCFKLSGTCEADFDGAVSDAMKHYRSSRYRFPDSFIEDRVRSMARERLGADSGAMTAVLPVVDESDYLLEDDKEVKDQKPLPPGARSRVEPRNKPPHVKIRPAGIKPPESKKEQGQK